MKNVNTNKKERRDVKAVMGLIKVHGNPIDKSDFWFYVEGDMKTVFHVSEGNGMNLTDEDVEEGFNDYIYYEVFGGDISYEMIDRYMQGDTDDLDSCMEDGGEVLLYGMYADLSVKQVCYKVLNFYGYSHPETLTVRILSGRCVDDSFLSHGHPQNHHSVARQTCIAIWYKTKGDAAKAMEILTKKIPLDPGYISEVARAEKEEVEKRGAKLHVAIDEDFPDELKRLRPFSLCYIEKDGIYSPYPIFCGIK